MTKKLEELFNLSGEESSTEPADVIAERVEHLREIDLAIDKIDAALPTVRDLAAADEEMDNLAQLAEDNFKELMSLGMNVEARFAGTILQTAGTLLGHAITAKQAKMDKKLRMVDLQLKKMRLDMSKPKDEDAGNSSIDGQGIVLGRNELLAQILSSSKKPDKH
jgi:hypothetical protein